MRGGGPTAVKSVIITINGVEYRGTYFVQGSTVHVQSTLGRKAAQVGGSPEIIAKLLLLELVCACPSAQAKGAEAMRI
jgi:hypothetical protein